MKKTDNTRSHSWWWDSHISPKNSKWLQDNLAEMDTKVSAMLKIIEEDADSFAQKAEMYYKKRPELINLIEEFYRTYRALVERYNFLTKEIRLNIAPALQAQLGVSSESPQNSPVDIHLKRGIDAPDIISPSYSYAGVSEFDADSPSSMKGQTDDETSPLGQNYERRTFGFRARSSAFDDTPRKLNGSESVNGKTDVEISQLQKEVLCLQEENKTLASRASQDVSKLKELQLQLSTLQSRARSLEEEDKLGKRRLKAVQEKEQKLEAENLKLSHSLISLKEEKSQLLEQQKKMVEDSETAHQKIKHLEDQNIDLKAELLDVQSKHSENCESLEKSESFLQELRCLIANLQEEKLKDSVLINVLQEENEEMLKKVVDFEKSSAETLEQVLAQQTEACILQAQLTDVLKVKQTLEQVLEAMTQNKVSAEKERSLALARVEDLQKEVEEIQKNRQQEAENISKLNELIVVLEKEGRRAQSEILESSKRVHELETIIQEGQISKETLLANCQQHEDNCKVLELKYAESSEKLFSTSQEVSRLDQQIQSLKDMITTLQAQQGELEQNNSSLLKENKSLVEELQIAVERSKSAEKEHVALQVVINNRDKEIEMFQQELSKLQDEVKKLEDELVCLSKEKAAVTEQESQTLLAYYKLENEHGNLKQKMESEGALIEGLKGELSCLNLEKSELLCRSEQTEQKLLELQKANTVLSSQCLENEKNLQAAEEATTRVQEELALSLMKVSSLQEGIHAKDELLREKVSGIEMLQAHLAQSKEESGSFRQQLDVSSEKVMLLETSNNDLLSKLSELESVHRALSEKVSEREEKLEHVIHELAASQKQLELQQAILLEGSLMKETLEDSIRRLQQEISELKEVNQSLRDGHQKLLDEILLLKTSNHDLEADLEAAEKESGMLKGKLISSHEDVVAKSNQCNELTLKVSNLEAELDTAQEGHETLKMQLARAEIELMDSARKCYDSERRVQDLELSLSDLLAEKTGLTEQFNEMTQSVHTLKSTVIDLEKGNSALNDEKDLLSQQVSAFRIQEASLLNEMQQHTNTIHDLRTQIEGLKQDVLNSQEAEKRISLEHRKGLDECQSLQWKLQDLREDLNTRQEEKTTYLRDIDVHIGRSNELCSEVRRLESDKDCLQLKLSDLLAERVSLTKQLKERIESVHALEVAVGNSKKEITALEEDKAHLEQQVSTYKLQEACFLDEMQKSSEVLRDLRSEMERVKQELLNAQQNETKLYLQQKKSNDECQSFQQTVKDLQRDLSCCLEEKDLLLKNIESHSAKCNELSSEIKRLEAETDSTKLRLSESLDEKASLMEQLREKTERAQMFEMALVNLKKENATLNEEMGLLQQRTSAFRTEMGLLQQQASVFKTQEASLLAELHESSGIIQDLRSEIEGLKQEQRKSLEQCQSFQQNIKVLQHDLNSCLDEKALLLKTIDNHLANCNELSSEVRRLEAETDRVKLRLSESLDERASLMEQLKEKTECAQMFEMTLLNLKKDNSSLNEKMGLLQQQASAFKTQEASLLTELHESSDIIQGLRSEIEGLQQELLNAQEKEKRISLEQRKSVEECQSLQQNMMDLQRDLSRCLDEKALFVKTIDSHLENCNVLSSEVRRLEAETDCIKLRLSESSDEKASLMEQLKKKTETVQELESALHNLQKENTKLNDEMGLLQQQASAFRIQEASFLAESCKSSDIIQDLRSEMDGLKQELLNARENEKRVLLEKRKCIVECQSFQQVIKDLQCDLNNYAEEKTQFLKSIDSHLARCNELSSEVRRLESETDCLKLRLSELLDEKTLSMEQLREKTETIQDFEIALFNLKKDNATLNEEKGFLQEQVSAFKTQETSLLTELHKSSDIIQDLRSEMEGLRQALLKAQENEKIIFLEQRKSLEECNSFQQTINCLQQDLSICLEEKTSALRDVASHLGRSSELDFEVRRLEADKGTLELKLSEILTEKTSLSEQLTMKVESVNSLETTISDLKKENAILNQELHMLQQKISAFRTQEVSFINEMQRSSGMIHDLKSVMEGLKQEILDAQESEKRVSLEHRKSLDECELLQQTIKDLQRDLDTYNEEKALLLNDVANHSKRSRELDSETRRLETEKSCLQEELFRAQNIEHELRDEVNRLQKEREQLSVACNSLKDVNVKQEKDLQGLHQVIMRSKEEYQFEIHKMSLISEEKTLLLQDLKESQKELNKARGDCFKLQTDLDQLQQAVMIIETDMKKSVDELAVMKEHILVLQHVNADLERELELSTRQAVQKELEGMMLGEILAAAQDENVILEKHLTDMQIRAVENDHKSDKHQKDIEALQEELASAHFSRRELGQRLAHVQIESASSCNKIEEMRKEISELQARNGKLDADLQSVIVEGHENMVKLLSLQEELVCAGRLKLELSAKLSELTDEWDVTERRLQEDILQLKRDVDFHSASASKQENELRLLLEQKEALEAEKASMGKEAFELKQQIAESKSHLAMKDDNLSAKENLLLELQKQVQVYNEKNKDLVESLQELDTELAQSKNLDNMISENLENKCLSYDTTNNQGVSFMSLEASKHDEVSRFGDDHLKIINNVKEKLLILLKENHNAKAVSLTKQQEQISDLQEEILHLNSELKLYKQGVFLLKKIINGEDFQEKAEDKIAHEDAKALQVMLDSLRNTFVTLKLKVNELKEEAERELIQKRQLQAILIHCQTKGVALTSVLKNNFLLFCKGLKTMMSEFNRVACSNDSTFVVIDSLEILSRLEVLCSISDIQDQHNVSEANGTCLESDSQLPNSSSFLLGQLQKRVEESKLFVEAIKVMLPSKDECKDMTTSPINISNQITDSSSVEEMKNSLQHDQHLMLPAEHKESDILSSAEMADYIIKEISEEVRNEERDSIEGASLDQEQERDLIGGLAQLHINLGMRLQQALLDEKLESELQELKEERKKLKDGLDARVQQVQNMEMELEKLHIILKGGKEGIVDPRQQQLHIRHKKKAEKRARRLSSELVIQRQHVGRLQDAVATWTAQQELATEMLEEQVTTLVSNECTPNMDGWDASQVTQLLQEMQSHRALTKRHSMDLESVGHDLERVGSSIESTQRLLMEKVEGRENEDDDEIDRKTFPAKIASGTKSQGKLSRFGLTWLLLFFSTQRALFRRSASSTASVAPPRTAQRNSEVAGNALTSLVPQTRRMSCCACIMSSGRPHHLMALNEK